MVVVLGIILMVILSQNMRKPLENPDIAANSQVSSSQSTSEDNPVLSGQIQVVNGTFSITAQELVDGINHMVSLEYPLIGELQKEDVYKRQINYSVEMIQQCKAALERLYTCRDNLVFVLQNAQSGELPGEEEVKARFLTYRDHFIDAMEDDMNTADEMCIRDSIYCGIPRGNQGRI